MSDKAYHFVCGATAAPLKFVITLVSTAHPQQLMPLSQDVLREVWRGGQANRMCPWEQARALALREASREIHGGRANVEWVAARVVKNDGSRPTRQSLHELFALVDSDADWFPGKHCGKRRGPEPFFTPSKKKHCARVMMQVKHEAGDEPTVEEMKRRCPRATLNPRTGKTFDDKVLRRALTEDCYDLDPDHPWRFQTRLRKRYLTPENTAHRLAMCSTLLGDAYSHCSSGWYFQNVVWMDPCATILPGSKAQWLKMRQLLKGAKGYMSDNARMQSENLSGPETALKQRTFVGRKINWVIVLTRGVVLVKILPSDWQLRGEGMAYVVDCIGDWLRAALGEGQRMPRLIFTDRGTGMYSPAGRIVREYDHALRRGGWRPFFGPDAKLQAPDMGDLLPHETAVSWVRNRLRRMKPHQMPWEETEAQWASRVEAAVAYVNSHYNVDALCRSFPDRLRACVAATGGCLRS